jgi:nitrite reductase/ring-hydroxylating ferredoxin subunit
VSAPVAVRTGTEHRLGPIDQVPFGEGRAFDVAGQQVAVFRIRDGRVRALSAVCPHRGGPVADGQTDLRVVLCPLHLHAFDLDTGCSTTGAAPLRRYDVRLDGTEIVVTV